MEANRESDFLKSTYSTVYEKCPSESDYEPKTKPHEPAQFNLSVIKDKQIKRQTFIGASRKYVRPPGIARDYPICLGLGSYADAPMESANKPIVNLHRMDKVIIPTKATAPKVTKLTSVSDARDMLRPEEALDEMITRIKWIPSTTHQQEMGCLNVPQREIPSTTTELNSDVVRYRPMRYNSSAQHWQKVSSAWNRAQTRPSFNNPSRHHVDYPIYSDDVYAERRRQMRGDEKPKFHLSEPNFPEFRHIPRYGGFVPREPVEPYYHPAPDQYFSTSSSDTYRKIEQPRDPCCIHHRKAPMSRMITLVYPLNPFKRTPKTMQTKINPLKL